MLLAEEQVAAEPTLALLKEVHAWLRMLYVHKLVEPSPLMLMIVRLPTLNAVSRLLRLSCPAVLVYAELACLIFVTKLNAKVLLAAILIVLLILNVFAQILIFAKISFKN